MPRFRLSASRSRAFIAALPLPALPLAFLLAACGQQSAQDDGSIKVGMILPETGSPFAATDPGRVARIAASAVNDDGGIRGRKLEVIVCDTKGQAAASLACARKLADEGVIAFIGGSSADGVDRISRAKGIVNWFPMGSLPSDVKNPLSFITALNSAGAAQGAYLGARRFGAKSAVFVTMKGNTTYAQTAKFGYSKAGVDNVTIIEIPPATTDFAPYIARIRSLKPDVWGGMLYPPAQQTQLIEAASAQGLTIPFVGSNNVIENATLAALSAAPFANSVALEKGEDAQRFPVWKEYLRQLAKYDPEGKVTSPTDGSVTTDWYAVWSFAQVARKLEAVTVDGFRNYVTAARDFGPDIGSTLLHSIDFTVPSAAQNVGQPRQANTWAFQGHVADGKEVVDDAAPFSVWEQTPIKPWPVKTATTARN